MPKGSPRSPNLLVIVLGLLIIGAFAAAFVSVPTVGAMLVAVGLYVLFFALLLWRVGHPLDVIWVSIAGGAPVGFLVLGLGGLVALELSRLAGSSLSAGVLFVLVGGATIGSYLAVGLTAMAAGGVRRPWLPMASMLLVPAIIIGGSFLIRNALAAGAAALNYALLHAIFIGFGAAAWPRVSARYASALEEVRRDEERKQEERPCRSRQCSVAWRLEVAALGEGPALQHARTESASGAPDTIPAVVSRPVGRYHGCNPPH